MAGRRRKSNAEKRLEGTARADRYRPHLELPPAEDLTPPASLNGPEAVKGWRRIVDALAPAGIISAADVLILVHLCNLHGRCIRLWRAGESPTAAELTQVRMMLGEFGLTPATRSKVARAKGQPTDADPAEEFFTGPRLAE